MTYFLNCKKIETSISRIKKILILKAKNKGIYENFGQDEVQKIKDTFIDISDYSEKMNLNRQKLQLFNEWCMNYNG